MLIGSALSRYQAQPIRIQVSFVLTSDILTYSFILSLTVNTIIVSSSKIVLNYVGDMEGNFLK